MWVRHCRPAIGVHFHRNPQLPPVSQQLGEKGQLHIAWSVADFMLLFASALRAVQVCFIAVALHLWGLKLRIFRKMLKMISCGQRPLFGTPLVKNPQNEPPRSKIPIINCRGQNYPNLPFYQKSPNYRRAQKPPKLIPLVKNPPNESPWPKMP